MTKSIAPGRSIHCLLRIPILISLAVILAVFGWIDRTTLPLVISGVVVLLVVGVRLLTPKRPTGVTPFALSLAEAATCLAGAMYYGILSVIGFGFIALLVIGLASFSTRRDTIVYCASLLGLVLVIGPWLAGAQADSRDVLTAAAIIGATGTMAVVASASLSKMRQDVECLRKDLDEATVDRQAKSDNIVRLYEASQATSQEAEPGGIMDTLARDARRLVGCESASVAIFIEKDILASVTNGLSNEFKRNLRWRVRKGGMTDQVLSTGKPLVINEAGKDPISKGSSAVKIGKQQSIMAVPLATQDEVFGILYAGDRKANSFGQHQLMLLTILANHAAASMRQARLHRELKKKLEELEHAHKELIGADRLKSEFISAVTSQMRVPLDAIKTYSQTVLQKMDDSTFKLRKKFLSAVVEETSKLLSTVNGVIDLSRMEFGEGDLMREEIAVTEVLKDVCGILEPFCIDKELDVTVEAPQHLSPAYLDKDMVFLLFRNLVEVAISLARKSTSIRITVDEDQSFLKIELSLSPSSSILKMEKAIHAVSSKEMIPAEAGSLGLTLQVAKNIVFRHGGRIWSESPDPSTLTFVLLFGKERKAIMPSDLTLEIVTSRPELKSMLALIVDMISKVMGVDTCLLFLEDSATGNLMLGASVNSNVPSDSKLMVKKGEGLTGRVFEEGRPIVLNSRAQAAELHFGAISPFEKVPCASVPIGIKGRVIGVITVSCKCGDDAGFDNDDVSLFAALGDRIGVAMERATGYESARDQFVSAMVALKSVLEARRMNMGEVAGHTGLVVDLGRALGLDEESVRLLQYVSRIYDVGMVRVGEGILRKRGGLGVGEYESVKRHPVEGVDIVGPIEFLEQVKEIILHHHERYDGGGYPGGLQGEEIPLGARILAVVDAYSSMLSDRPYRGAMSVEAAVEELRKCSGTQFDPQVVEKFVEVVQKDQGKAVEVPAQAPRR